MTPASWKPGKDACHEHALLIYFESRMWVRPEFKISLIKGVKRLKETGQRQGCESHTFCKAITLSKCGKMTGEQCYGLDESDA